MQSRYRYNEIKVWGYDWRLKWMGNLTTCQLIPSCLPDIWEVLLTQTWTLRTKCKWVIQSCFYQLRNISEIVSVCHWPAGKLYTTLCYLDSCAPYILYSIKKALIIIHISLCMCRSAEKALFLSLGLQLRVTVHLLSWHLNCGMNCCLQSE